MLSVDRFLQAMIIRIVRRIWMIVVDPSFFGILQRYRKHSRSDAGYIKSSFIKKAFNLSCGCFNKLIARYTNAGCLLE